MHQNPLHFPRETYTVHLFKVNGQAFAVRAWEGLFYYPHPADDIQRLNLYAPEAFFSGTAFNGYTAQTAPSFYPTPWVGTSPAISRHSVWHIPPQTVNHPVSQPHSLHQSGYNVDFHLPWGTAA